MMCFNQWKLKALGCVSRGLKEELRINGDPSDTGESVNAAHVGTRGDLCVFSIPVSGDVACVYVQDGVGVLVAIQIGSAKWLCGRYTGSFCLAC